MSILLLGGTGESRALAQALIDRHFEVVYSIAGLVRTPRLDCEVRVGGFSGGGHDGVEGMIRFIRHQRISKVVDATHPYAVRISANAARAAGGAGVKCWRYERPGWDDEIRDAREFDDWDDLKNMLRNARRPFFTLGRSALDNLHRRRPEQHWIVRTAVAPAPVDHVTLVKGIGPFEYHHECDLLREHEVDALVTKNSGGAAGGGKLRAARDLGIPVFVQRRPALPEVDRVFHRIEPLLKTLEDDEGQPLNARATESS